VVEFEVVAVYGALYPHFFFENDLDRERLFSIAVALLASYHLLIDLHMSIHNWDHWGNMATYRWHYNHIC